MNKTLLNFLKEQSPDEMIYVKTTGGTGWVLIEEAGVILSKINDFEKNFYKHVLDINHKAAHKTQTFPNKIVLALSDIRKMNVAFENKNLIKETEDNLHDLERQYVEAYKIRESTFNSLHRWIPLFSRKVIGTYCHVKDIPGTAVIIKGDEPGELKSIRE